jgi:hypothetical protein
VTLLLQQQLKESAAKLPWEVAKFYANLHLIALEEEKDS